MKRLACVLSVLTATCVSGLLAQPGGPPRGGGPRHIEGLAKRLELNENQKERATAIYDAAAKANKTLRTSEREAHDALASAVEKNDTVQIDRLSLQIGTLMAQELATESKAEASFRQTLSAEQLTKLDKMHTRRGPPPPTAEQAGSAARPQRARRPPPPPAAE